MRNSRMRVRDLEFGSRYRLHELANLSLVFPWAMPCVERGHGPLGHVHVLLGPRACARDSFSLLLGHHAKSSAVPRRRRMRRS